jgi:pimeloyl-ACP methyl ester carboxylesterase
VLLHGLASLSDEMLHPLGAPLTEAGFRVVAIDRSGYGGSDAVMATQMGPAAQAAGLDRTLARLGLADAIVVAHSAGAAPALHLAARRTRRVAGLVLVSPFCRPTRPKAALGLRAATAPVIGAPLRRLLPRVAPTLGRAMVRGGLRKGQRMPSDAAFPWRRMAQPTAVRAMAAELRGFNDDMISLRTRLKTVASPTLVLIDPEDRVIDAVAHARWLKQRVPTCAVRQVPAGHLLHHFEVAEVVDAVVSIDVAIQVGLRRIA